MTRKEELEVIAEQQAKRIRELEEWRQIVIGAGTDQEAVIRMAATEYAKVQVRSWKEKCEYQAKEIDAHEKLSKMNGEELSRLDKQNQALREALQSIVDGEGLWTKSDMAHKAQQALKEVNNGML